MSLVDDVTFLARRAFPLLEGVVPVSATGVHVAMKLIQGVIAAEPTAMALYQQIKTGATVTEDQLTKFATDYNAAYQALDDDIAAQLAARGEAA